MFREFSVYSDGPTPDQWDSYTFVRRTGLSMSGPDGYQLTSYVCKVFSYPIGTGFVRRKEWIVHSKWLLSCSKVGVTKWLCPLRWIFLWTLVSTWCRTYRYARGQNRPKETVLDPAGSLFVLPCTNQHVFPRVSFPFFLEKIIEHIETSSISL